MWLTQAEEEEHPRLKAIADRARRLARLPPPIGTELRIRRWGPGGGEGPMVDSLHPEDRIIAKSVVFLSGVEQGGEFVFPLKAGRVPPGCGGSLATCCEKSKVRVRPQKGDALLVFAHTLDARPDLTSSHAKCPVLAGESWVAERIFRFGATPVDLGLVAEAAKRRGDGGQGARQKKFKKDDL